MPTQKKVEIVDELRQLIGESEIAIGMSYQGLKVSELQQFRRRLKEAGVELHVVKNTLLRLAATEAGRPTVGEIVQGPTAIIFGAGDMSVIVRTLTDYIRTTRLPITLRGASFDGQLVPASQVEELATLPPKPVLLAQVMGAIEAPLASLVGLLESPMSSFVGLLDAIPREVLGVIEARAQQLESA
jgi:large subunit ribosomal protein L10